MLLYNKPKSIQLDKVLGYEYFLDKTHPLSHKNTGKVYLHRHLMSIKLGRWLTPEEIVHHIDGNKSNNSLHNLEVLSKKEHAHLHQGTVEYTELSCPVCGTLFKVNSVTAHLRKHCSEKCSKFSQIKDKTITKELLDELIPTTTWVELGKIFGYSDVGIKKRAKALGCTIPVRRK